VLNAPTHPYTRALVAAVPPLTARPPRPIAADLILTMERVNKTYRARGLLRRGARVTHAVKDVTLALPRGATLGVVGESGSGKSTLARCIVRLIEPDSGAVRLEGTDLLALSRREMRRADATHADGLPGSLSAPSTPGAGRANWWRRADHSRHGPWEGHGAGEGTLLPRRSRPGFDRPLPAPVLGRPAAADRPRPGAGTGAGRAGGDEPVSALDVSVQAQVLRLLAELRERLGLSLVFITHDLRVAAQVCDLVAVMKSGEVVEHGPIAEVFSNPRHPYTRSLLASVPGRDFAPLPMDA
jgi:peptide/nickel transport system ATP-binding protein